MPCQATRKPFLTFSRPHCLFHAALQACSAASTSKSLDHLRERLCTRIATSPSWPLERRRSSLGPGSAGLATNDRLSWDGCVHRIWGACSSGIWH